MYNFYQQFRALVLGGEREEEAADSNKSTPRKAPDMRAQERYFSGVVTSMDQSSGMIDHQVFFELGHVIGGQKPMVGCSVHVHAQRAHPQAGWKATRVEVTSQWLSEGRSEREVLTGYISKLSPTLGIVDCGTDEISFVPREVAASGYRPHANDWVQVTILHQDEESKVTGIGPLREKMATGTVTSVSSGFGTIDDNVYFTLSACMRGYRARVGDRVAMECVEYNHPRSNWRAVLIEPALDAPPTSASMATAPHPRLLEDKQGVVVSRSGLNLGAVEVGEERVFNIVVSNYSDVARCLLSCKPLFRDEQLEVVLPVPVASTVGEGFHSPDDTCGSHTMGCPGNHVPNERGCLTDDALVVTLLEHSSTPAQNAGRTSGHDGDHFQSKLKNESSECCQEGAHCEEKVLKDNGRCTSVQLSETDSLVGEKRENCSDCREEGCVSGHSKEGEQLDSGGRTSPLDLPGMLAADFKDCSEREGKSTCEAARKEKGCRQAEARRDSQASSSSDNTQSCLNPPGLLIPSGETMELTVHLKAKIPGQLATLLILNFRGFKIARYIQASITDPQTRLLVGDEDRQPRGQGGRRGGGRGGRYHAKMAACRVPGEKPLRSRPLRLPHRLKPYPIPDDLRACLEEGGDVTDARIELGEPLCMENYGRRFSALLHLEELRREEDIRQFDMFNVSMRRHGPYLSLAVPGLAERRPSLLMGDRVIVCEPGGNELCPQWEGFIHEVHGEEVYLKFTEEFHASFRNEDHDIMFTFNRTPIRRMHHAVEMAEMIGAKCLFPGLTCPKPPLLKLHSHSVTSDSDGCVPSPYQHQHQFFNLALNPRQRAAVKRIAGGQSRPTPYILFGPPGTGKTVTVVEAILQIHRLSKGSRILACAPSNSATDLLAERLHQSGRVRPGVMVRLNAVQRLQLAPPCVEPYCMNTDSVDIAARSRIVVATCVTAGILHSLGLGVGHFSHVFVDEAGQATEPECLIPISLLAGQEGSGQVVLAGDPHQLGPILASPLAGSYGMALSLLERLMQRPAYQRDVMRFGDHGNYDPIVVTKLVSSYRAHPSLLRLYSDIFYHGELEACADPSLTHVLCDWELLPTKGFPLVFHGVLGEDMQEGNSPSWFNPAEAVQVVMYTQALRENSTFAPKLSDIGIITPYRKQVEKIRLLLQRVGLEDVKVGSVEEFQGQERLAIIISTVRSTPDLLAFDARHHLGFLSNPKRFNVAISRAKALLVVIGNPHLLLQDPYWSRLVDYALENQAYVGCPLHADTAVLSD